MARGNAVPILVLVVASVGTVWWLAAEDTATDLGGDPPGAVPTETAPAPTRPKPPPVPPDELERMAQALRDAKDPHARQVAAHALALKGPSAAGAALTVVDELERETDVEVRRKLIWTLGEMRDVSAAPTLRRIAREDPDPSVRRQAAQELPRLAPLQAEEVLAAFDAEAAPAVRATWLQALHKAQGGDTELVRDRLVGLARHDADPTVRGTATGLLAGRCSAVDDPVYLALEDRLLRDGDPQVRGAAAYALLSSRLAAARQLVRKAATDDPNEKVRNILHELLGPGGEGEPGR